MYCELIGQTITITQPASERRSQPGRQWTLPDLGFTPRYFTCDHSQRLLVLLQTTCVKSTFSNATATTKVTP